MKHSIVGMFAVSIFMAGCATQTDGSEPSTGRIEQRAGTSPVEFSSEADAISGTVTLTELDVGGIVKVQSIDTIDAVAQSNTSNSGSDDQPLASASHHSFGVNVFTFSNIDDATSVSAADDEAIVSIGSGSLLGGLITWSQTTEPLSCLPDSANPNQEDCSSVERVTGLTIAGEPVPRGTHPAGYEIPVHGIVQGGCLVPQTFDGTLTFQELTITGAGTSDARLDLVGMHLRGTSTCLLSHTDYDLHVGGPVEGISITGVLTGFSDFRIELIGRM